MNDSEPFEMPPELVARFGPEITAELCACIDAEIDRRDGELAVSAFRAGLACGIGRTNADIVMADLTGNADQSNAAIAAAHSRCRATISRTINVCRRNLGLSVRVPKNARAGAKPQGTAMPTNAGDLA